MKNPFKGLDALKEPISALVKEIEALKIEMRTQTEILKEIHMDMKGGVQDNGKTVRDD